MSILIFRIYLQISGNSISQPRKISGHQFFFAGNDIDKVTLIVTRTIPFVDLAEV